MNIINNSSLRVEKVNMERIISVSRYLMEQSKLISYLPVILLSTVCIFTGCKEDDPSPPIITSINPTLGYPETLVTITGSNFNPSPEGNKVTFGGKEAQITSSSESVIIVKVPALGTTGEIMLKTSGGMVKGPVFTYREIPVMEVDDVTDLGAFEATLNGRLLIGSEAVIDHGFIYSKDHINSINDGTKISFGSIHYQRRIKASISDLSSNQKYYVKTYAVTADTLVFSSEMEFTTIKTNTWIKVLSLSQGRDLTMNNQYAGFEIGGKGYLIAGIRIIENVGFFIPFHQFDPAAQTYVLEDCPVPYRDDYVSFAINDTIYVGLGHIFNGVWEGKKDIWKYNVTSKRWKQGGDFPIETNAQLSFSANGYGYITGRDNAQKMFLYQYVPQLGSWFKKSVPDYFSFYFAVGAFSINNTGFVICENRPGVPFIWKYDPLEDKWTRLSQVPVTLDFNNRTFCLSAKNRGFLITTSRYSGNCTFLEYNPENDTWTDKGMVPNDGSALGGFTLNNRLYVVTYGEELFMYIPE